MANRNYTIHDKELEITDGNEEGQYTVVYENKELGYIYVDEVSDDTGRMVWAGSTPYLTELSTELGEYLEKSNLSV